MGSKEPIAAASLGQVHLGTLKKSGQKVAVKVQRAGLRELFATDLKNLRKLCELLDSVDPKSDGADRSYIDVFDESEKLLYEEIDYLNEAKNADRFREQFKDDPQVRVPEMIYEFSTPKVLTMEFIESFKLTQPRKIAYLEETMRAIEQGQLKIRVRSLENEMALTRLGTQSSGMTNLLLSSLVLNVASVAKLASIPQLGLFGIAGLLGFSGLSSLLKLSALDKKA